MAKNPGGRQENTKGSKGSFSAGATPKSASDKQVVATGGGGGDGGGFLASIFGGGNNEPNPRNWATSPSGASMDVISKPYVGGKTSPNYGQVNLGMAASGTPGLSDKLALNQAAMAAAQEPQGIMGVLGNLMPGSVFGSIFQGAMKHARPRSAFAPRYGVDGQLTDYGRRLEAQQASIMRDMAERSRLESDPSYGPTSELGAATLGMMQEQQGTPPTTTDPTQIPGQRPPWWPSYLPWPPAPNAVVPPPPSAPAAATQPTGSLPAPTPYGTSYSNLQSAISGAQNPLMMGIGGMLRRP